MGTLALGRSSTAERGLRPLDVLRDLDQVSRLLRLVFGDATGAEGVNLQRDLSFMQAVSPLVWFLQRASLEAQDSLAGYVWVEDGRLVGNASLSRQSPQNRLWIIGNVAVHPAYRRRGIARSMMDACIEHVAGRGGGTVALQVYADNRHAYDLYSSLGFTFLGGTVTAVRSAPTSEPAQAAAGARPVSRGEWLKLYRLAIAATPESVQKVFPIQQSVFWRSLPHPLVAHARRLLLGKRSGWLAIDEGARFLAAAELRLARQARTVSLLIHPDGQGLVEEPLIAAALAALSADRPHAITVLAPSTATTARSVLRGRGFHETQDEHLLVLPVEPA